MLDSLFRLVGSFGFVGVVLGAGIVAWHGLANLWPTARKWFGDGLGSFLTVLAIPTGSCLVIWLISIAPNQEDFVSGFGFALVVLAAPFLLGWAILRLLRLIKWR